MNNIQNNYLVNLGRHIRKQMRENGLTIYDFGTEERMVDKSTISRIINSKENLSRKNLDAFLETLVLKTSFCLY
ncbi:TPA: helix-turn-helix transcriptional regulator, partial [Streptococcus suis]|nr:helix-turn-helix transcriptional regulator [Streptococcus suis]